MPTRRANSLHNTADFTITIGTTFLFRHVYCGNPYIKATVLGAVCRIITIAETPFRLIIQILRHPDLFADGYSFVRLTITFID